MLNSAFTTILFTLLKVVCWAINRLTQLFEVFSGVTKVSYRGEATFLYDIFLNHTTISNIYWGMALLGIVLCFVFAIASVVRKMFDLNGKQQMSLGQIITEALKSIFIILGMNLILSVALVGTDTLMRQINYLFLNSEGLERKEVVEFTDDQYSAMGRALSTIANYGMNPSYNSRYNINDCFNTIRPDLIYLEEQGVFDYSYGAEEGNSWQSVLQEVAHSADLRYDLKGDVYYETVTDALEKALAVMRSDGSFRPLDRFEETRSMNIADVPLDRIVFLTGTLDSANNGYFNQKPSFTDALRLPYYTGEKSLYDTADTESIKVINKDFDLSPSRFDYLVSFVLGIAVLYNTFVIILSLIARMFNILFLYIIAPPVLAVRPLDGGGKSKQWMSAFIVQLLGVLGSIIVMRLLLIFVPIIFSPELTLISGNASLNYFAKAVMLVAAYAVAKKAGALLSGILSDTAAMQSMQAGDMSAAAQRVTGAARAVAGRAVRTVGGAVGNVVSFAASPLTNRLNKPFESYRRMGSGASDSDIKRQAQERLAVDNMISRMRGGSDRGSGGGKPGNGPPPSGGGTGTRKRSASMPAPNAKKLEKPENERQVKQPPFVPGGGSDNKAPPPDQNAAHSDVLNKSKQGGGASEIGQMKKEEPEKAKEFSGNVGDNVRSGNDPNKIDKSIGERLRNDTSTDRQENGNESRMDDSAFSYDGGLDYENFVSDIPKNGDGFFQSGGNDDSISFSDSLPEQDIGLNERKQGGSASEIGQMQDEVAPWLSDSLGEIRDGTFVGPDGELSPTPLGGNVGSAVPGNGDPAGKNRGSSQSVPRQSGDIPIPRSVARKLTGKQPQTQGVGQTPQQKRNDTGRSYGTGQGVPQQNHSREPQRNTVRGTAEKQTLPQNQSKSIPQQQGNVVPQQQGNVVPPKQGGSGIPQQESANQNVPRQTVIPGGPTQQPVRRGSGQQSRSVNHFMRQTYRDLNRGNEEKE